MWKDMARAGLTTVGGLPAEDIDSYRKWASEGRLNMRFYCLTSVPARNPQGADATIAQIPQLRRRCSRATASSTCTPMASISISRSATTWCRQGDREAGGFRAMGTHRARDRQGGMPVNQHATLVDSIDGFLDQIEQINKDYPVKNLRWSLIHLDQLNATQIERMKKLGMYAGVQPRSTIMGAIFHRVHGQSADNTPPFKTIQDSGIMWGLGTDAFEVNQYRPFATLGFAVTGKMVGGTVVNKQTISREDALIAHTRNNSYFLFQEDNLGSIAPGKLADLVVLDRDYLTIPADQIKDIQPVLTMVAARSPGTQRQRASSMRRRHVLASMLGVLLGAKDGSLAAPYPTTRRRRSG